MLIDLIRQHRNALERSRGLITQHRLDITAPDAPRPPEFHQERIDAHQADAVHHERVIGLLSAGLTAEERAALDPQQDHPTTESASAGTLPPIQATISPAAEPSTKKKTPRKK